MRYFSGFGLLSYISFSYVTFHVAVCHVVIYFVYISVGHAVAHCANRNEYQEYLLGGKGGRCVGLTTLPLSCCDCLEIWEPQPAGTLRACPGL